MKLFLLIFFGAVQVTMSGFGSSDTTAYRTPWVLCPSPRHSHRRTCEIFPKSEDLPGRRTLTNWHPISLLGQISHLFEVRRTSRVLKNNNKKTGKGGGENRCMKTTAESIKLDLAERLLTKRKNMSDEAREEKKILVVLFFSFFCSPFAPQPLLYLPPFQSLLLPSSLSFKPGDVRRGWGVICKKQPP